MGGGSGAVRRSRAVGERHRAARSTTATGLLFVEGPADRAIVEGWARSISPRFERVVRASTVILGGRQPARARAQFLKAREKSSKLKALCVLDPDAFPDDESCEILEGFEVFYWKRRHIESYLMAPDAIRRALRRKDHDGALMRFLRASFPDPEDEEAHRRFHAKDLLGPKGPIASKIGHTLPIGRIARAMRPEEFHPDIHHLLARLQVVLGFSPLSPVVTHRRQPRETPL